jgi:hypothetical protein
MRAAPAWPAPASLTKGHATSSPTLLFARRAKPRPFSATRAFATRGNGCARSRHAPCAPPAKRSQGKASAIAAFARTSGNGRARAKRVLRRRRKRAAREPATRALRKSIAPMSKGNIAATPTRPPRVNLARSNARRSTSRSAAAIG